MFPYSVWWLDCRYFSILVFLHKLAVLNCCCGPPDCDRMFHYIDKIPMVIHFYLCIGLKDAGAYLERRVAGLRRVTIQRQHELHDFTTYLWGYKVRNCLLANKLIPIFTTLVIFSTFMILLYPLHFLRYTFPLISEIGLPSFFIIAIFTFFSWKSLPFLCFLSLAGPYFSPYRLFHVIPVQSQTDTSIIFPRLGCQVRISNFIETTQALKLTGAGMQAHLSHSHGTRYINLVNDNSWLNQIYV